MILISVIASLIIVVILFINFNPIFGAKAKGGSLTRMEKSANYENGKFKNIEVTEVMINNNSMFSTMWEWIKGPENGTPDSVITKKFNKTQFLSSTDSSFSITWLGHSSVLINLANKIILTDPVFSKYASPVPFTNKSFKFSNNITAEDLPDIDYLLISHDHYDHLDMKTIQDLDVKVKVYYVPLGVDAHLISWGVSPNKIVVADWWDEFKVDGNILFAATPARHFSGRGLDRNSTLWCSWVIKSDEGDIYFGADSGYGSHFKAIGDKYGPFNLTMIECGQYNKNWPNIHAMPEQSVQANIDLQGEKMMAIHWSKFQLSLHSWTEPIERARVEAKRLNVNLVEPQIGDVVVFE